MKQPAEDIFLEIYNKSASVSELSFSSNSGSRTQLLSKDFEKPLNANYARYADSTTSIGSDYPQATVILFYLEIFFGCITFSIVVPTLWPYLESLGMDEVYLGICVATYSFGSLVGSLLTGSLYNCLGPKWTLLFSIFAGFIGASLHFGASIMSAWAILAGRFLTGFMIGGQMTVENSYIGAEVPENIRTKILGRMQLSACLGFIFGPAATLPFDLQDWQFDLFYFLPINYMTLPGLLMMALCIILFLAVVVVFEDRPIRKRSALQGDSPPNLISCLFIMWIVFVQDQTFVIQETLATPIIQDTFETLKIDVILLYSVAGVITFFTVLTMSEYLSPFVSDFWLLFISCILGFFGSMLCAQLPPPYLREHLFVVGFVFMIITMPFGRGPLLSIYSKIVATPYKGKYMGYLFTVSSFARIVAPIYGAEFLRQNGPHFIWLLSAFFFLITMFFLLAYSHLLSGKLSYFEIRPKKESELSKETLSVYEAF